MKKIPTVYLLTGNHDKIQSAKRVFGRFGLEIEPLDVQIPEIQAKTSLEVASDMAKKAFDLVKKPVIREDHSFVIQELGFPGPFMSYADKTISPEQLAKIVSTLKDRSAYFELAAAFVDQNGHLHEYQYRVPVNLTTKPSGSLSSGWERLMQLPGHKKTFAETDSSERKELWEENFFSIAQTLGVNN